MFRKKVLPLVLVVLLLGHLALPFADASTTAGRSGPNFQVNKVTFDGDNGSINDDTRFVLAPGGHTVRVTVSNIGTSSANAFLSLVHKGSPSAAEQVVDTVDIGSLAIGIERTYLLTWTATTGPSQVLFARISTDSGDTNPLDNELARYFDVETLVEGNVSSDNLPEPDPGATTAFLNTSTHDINVSVLNYGVMKFSAVMQYVLTNASNVPPTIEEWSNTETINASTLYKTELGTVTPRNLTASLDGSTLTGLWNLSVRVVLNHSGSAVPDVIIHKELDVIFSQYRASLAGPLDRTTTPGTSTTLYYVIKNTGSLADNYKVSVNSRLGWGTNSTDLPTGVIQPGDSTTQSVIVNVPPDAEYVSIDKITMTIVSSGNGYTYTNIAHVMADEYLEATIDITNDTTFILPGNVSSIPFNVTNSGNAPASFSLISGLTSDALNWNHSLSMENTGILQPLETVSGFIYVGVPDIQLPLVAAEKNRAGTSLGVYIIANAESGGVPTTDSGQVEVLPIILVDPGLPTDTIYLTESDVFTRAASDVNEIVTLEVQVRHNLASDLTETVDANIEVGDISFEALTSGGFKESERWTAMVTPDQVDGLALGETYSVDLGIQSFKGELPLAGTVKIPITTTPTLGSVHSSSQVYDEPIEQVLSIVVPRVVDGEITETGPLDADVGIDTDFLFTFANTGNDRTSYRLEIVENLPSGWDVSLDTANSDNTILDLASDFEDYPATSGAHLSLVTLTVKTDPQAPADLLQPLTIRYYELDSGAYIGQQTMDIRVGETVNASLTPTNQSIDITPYQQLSAFVNIENTGNGPTTFALDLNDGGYSDVDFALDSPSSITVAAGYEASVRINIIPTVQASADEFYMANLTVSMVNETGTVVELYAHIVANVSEVHDVQLSTNEDSIAAVPGTVQTIDFSIENTGNLVETVNINITVDGGWTTTPTVQTFTIPINGIETGSFDVEIPALDGTGSMLEGTKHDVNLTVYNPVTDEVYALKKVELRVAPVFSYTIEGWESQYYFHRGTERALKAYITNTGNKDVWIDVGYQIREAGLATLSDEWEVVDSETTLYLPMGKPTELSIKLKKTVSGSITLNTEADLRVTLVPSDPTVEGSGELFTSLQMKRLFDNGQASELKPSDGDNEILVSIEYSHIPYLNDAPAAYSIEFCGIERILDFDEIDQQDEDDYVWNISLTNLEGEESEHYLNLTAPCIPGSELIELPERAAFTTSPSLLFKVLIPSDGVLEGDGYDITMLLHHPDPSEPVTEEVFRFALDVYANPRIVPNSQRIYDLAGNELDFIMEGQTVYLDFELINVGTADAIGMNSELVCDGLVVEDNLDPFILKLSPQESQTLRWKVTGKTLDWWEQSETIDCTARVVSSFSTKLTEDDELVYPQTVESSAPSTLTSFAGFGIALIVTIGLLGLTNQNEKYRLGAVYSGVVMLGFLFHLYDTPWWGPATIAIASLWVWRMAWRSSEEFRYIHEDYQRARKGISTIYADHFQALADSRRQLTIILSLPFLGFVGVVLGMPPQMKPNQVNLVSIVAYILLSTIVVWFILRRANKLYGTLYGKLTDIEVKATRIERDLGDPARLLNDLAMEGLDLSAVLESPQATGSSDVQGSADGLEEVMSNGEEQA